MKADAVIILHVTKRQGEAVVLRAAPSPKGAGDETSPAPCGQERRRTQESRRVPSAPEPLARGSLMVASPATGTSHTASVKSGM